jgi:hypothetical protein
VVAIDLTKVQGSKLQAWEIYPPANGIQGVPYQYAFWQQEVSVESSIPRDAIIGFVK